MNTKHTKRAFWLSREEPQEDHCPTVLFDSEIRRKIENANLIAFGAWLAIGVVILAAIAEMRGW